MSKNKTTSGKKGIYSRERSRFWPLIKGITHGPIRGPSILKKGFMSSVQDEEVKKSDMATSLSHFNNEILDGDIKNCNRIL